MNTPCSINDDSKKTKNSLRIATTFYLILLPFAAIFAVGSLLAFDSPSLPIPIGLTIILLYWSIPISIPLTIYLMWRQYSKENYKKSRHLLWIPVYIISTLFLFGYLVNLFLE
jgi:hypothetical protein